MNDFYFNNLLMSASKDYCVLGFRFLFEKHTNICQCSYCKDLKHLLEIWLPENKKWNSWRVIAWKFGLNKYYIRFTFPNPNPIGDIV